MSKTDITPNDDASVTITLNEDEINTIEKFTDSRRTLADATEDCVSGLLCGDVSSVQKRYEKRALAIGVLALELEEFWHKFRRRFPGTYWGARTVNAFQCHSLAAYRAALSMVDWSGKRPRDLLLVPLRESVRIRLLDTSSL